VTVKSTVSAHRRLGGEHALDEFGQSALDEVTATHQDFPVLGGERMSGYGAIEDPIFGIETDGVICGSQFIIGNRENRLDVTVLCKTDHTSYEGGIGRRTSCGEVRGIPGSEHNWGKGPSGSSD